MAPRPGCPYRYKGNNYIVRSVCLIKDNKHQWVEGVIYSAIGDRGTIYVRETSDFRNKFELIEAWMPGSENKGDKP